MQKETEINRWRQREIDRQLKIVDTQMEIKFEIERWR